MTTKVQGITGFATCVLCLWGAWAPTAYGQASYPGRPIRVIVPFAPGGGSDVMARFLGPRLADRLGQPVVVDNRPAASGIVGADLVAKATPDGHTLLLVFSTHAQSAQLFTKLPYDPAKDFAPITLVISTPLGMLLHPAVPAKTVKEFIAHAGLKRTEGLPEVPTIAESGVPGFEALIKAEAEKWGAIGRKIGVKLD